MEESLSVFWFARVIFIGLLRCTLLIAGNDSLKFIMIGDFGGVPFRPYSTPSQRLVSRRLAEIRNVDFFVGLGDNFYYHGVKDVNDERFTQTFEDVYSHPSLRKDWYMVAGNHDYLGNVSAQVLYSRKSKRWKFPHYFYTKVFNIPGTNKTLQIVMLDTMILCFESGTKRQEVPRAKTQVEWLGHTLENSKADYLIVGGHHPIFSAGVHGKTKCLQEMLEDLFRKHKVTAYFCGHDHNLQHIKLENSSVEYFVTGAGNFISPMPINLATLEPGSLKKFLGHHHGFLVLKATAKHLEIRFRTMNPSQRYRRFLPPRAQQSYEIEHSQLLTDFFQSRQLTHNKP